jgi:hypothetical protein
LVVQAAGRRDEDRAVDPVRMLVGELADDRTAHRVAHERRHLELPVVHEVRGGGGQVGDVERLEGAAAAAEAGKVGDQGVELVGEALGRRHEIPAGQAEAMQVHHDRRVG